jgi:phosphoglycolate phosphatase
MKPNLVIFDLDGTLVNSLPDIIAAVNETLRFYGKPEHSLEQVKENVGDGPVELVRRMFKDSSEIDIDQAVKTYVEIYEKHSGKKCTLMSGVKEVLEFLDGTPMAVVSNKISRFVDGNLTTLGIRRYFKMIVGFDSGFPQKPDPKALLHVCSTFSVKPADTAMVGDGWADVAGGNAAGIPTYAILGGFSKESKLRAQHPKHIIRRIDELIKLWS